MSKQLAHQIDAALQKVTASQVGDDAKELYNLMVDTFKRLGWKAERKARSAITECYFTPNGDLDGETYSFGWHIPGTAQARRYGITEMRLLDAHHDDGNGKTKMLCDVDILDASGKDHAKACAEMTKFLKGLK